MDENKNTPASTEEAKPEKKGINIKIDKKILLIGIAALLLIATVVTVCIVLANKAKSGGNNTPPTELTSVDILDGDLSDYISIDEKYYKGYQVVINNRITDILTNHEIIKARYKHRKAGVRFYVLDGETKMYIEIYQDDTGVNVKLTAEPTAVFTYNETAATYVATIGTDEYYIGTFGENEDLRCSKITDITGDNKANVGVSRYIAALSTLVSADSLPNTVETPVVETAYKLAMYNAQLNKHLYFDGTMEDCYLGVTDKAVDAVDVYMETVGDGIISIGDEVNIFYKGYYLEGEEKVYFSGGSNVGGTSHKLGIGSGGFVAGFEYNMIGKNPADYSADNPMIVETYFPKGYKNNPALAGKIAYFEVSVEVKDGKYQITEYDVPALDDAFILEKLELTEGKLSSFAGETLAEKYRAYIRDDIIKNGEMNQDDLALDAFWESVLAGAVVKKYPEKQLQQAYDDKMEEIIAYYNYYYSNYYTLEQFGCLYFNLAIGSDWRAEITRVAKEEIKQQLVFYHIMNVEGLKPTQLEYERRFDEYLVAALDEEGKTPDKFKTQEEYEAMKESKKAELIASRSEEYFKAMIYYEIGVKAVIEFAEFVEIN